MKKIALIIVLYIFPITLFGQTLDSIKYKKLDLGFTYSPEFSYRYTTSDDVSKFLEDSYDSLEVPKYGYSLGLNGVYTLSNKLGISVGILFSDKGERFKSDVLPYFSKYSNHYYYLDVPIRAKYTIFENDRNFKFYGTAGISLNTFLNHTIEYTLSGGNSSIRTKGNTDISKINFAGLLGIGIDCTLTNRWYFKAELNYRQSLNSMTSNANIKRYLYSFGPTVGLFYKL